MSEQKNMETCKPCEGDGFFNRYLDEYDDFTVEITCHHCNGLGRVKILSEWELEQEAYNRAELRAGA